MQLNYQYNVTWAAPRLRLGLAAALLSCMAACSRSPVFPPVALCDTLAPLYGRIYHDGPVNLVPDGGWSLDATRGGWVIASNASLLCRVSRSCTRPLVIELALAQGSEASPVAVLWDGAACPDLAVRAGRTAWRVTIPARLLTVGLHRITFRRPEPAKQSPPPALVSLDVRCGRYRTHAAPADLGDVGREAALTGLGVTSAGKTPDLRGGFLFWGSRRLPVRLSLSAPSSVRVVAANGAPAEAVFWVQAGPDRHEKKIASGASERLNVPLDAGDHDLTFGVDGAANGRYFWGSPTLVRGDQAGRPPLILITLDTTRRDAVAPYNRGRGVTPNLRRFSEQATVFTRAIASSPWTLPSHASLFTGLYPGHHGAGVRRTGQDPLLPTLAGTLRDRGYSTAGFAGAALTSHRRGMALGFSYYRNADQRTARADELTRKAAAWLDETAGQPVFLFINYFDPHFPYETPLDPGRQAGAERLLEKASRVPEWGEALAAHDGDRLCDLAAAQGGAPEIVRRALRAMYDAEVAFMDEQLGLLFDKLKALGLYDRALIAVMADHGELLGENDLLFHSYRLDRELVHIPFMIKWPGQRGPLVDANPVSLVDLFPTLLAAVGVEPPASDGVPLEPAGSASAGARPRVFSEEHAEPVVHPLPRKQVKLADDVYGAISPTEVLTAWDGGHLCHRWRGDAWIAQTCENDWQVDLEMLTDMLEMGAPADEAPGGVPLSGQEKEALKSLGYLK